MISRRITRLTNAFSKKAYNFPCTVALTVLYYNFAKPHITLTCGAHGKPTTPAMAAGLADSPWTMGEIVQLIEPRGPDAREISGRRLDASTGYHGKRA